MSKYLGTSLANFSMANHIKTGLYKHYKYNDAYHVLGCVLHTETNELMVLYKELVPSKRNPDNLLFVRPKDTFTEVIKYRGKYIQRFEKT